MPVYHEDTPDEAVIQLNPGLDFPRYLGSIDVRRYDLDEVTNQIIEGIRQSNNPAYLFQSRGQMARLEADEHGVPRLQEMTPDRVMHLVARQQRCYRVDRRGDEQPAPPSYQVAKNVLASPLCVVGLPVVERVVGFPAYNRRGILQIEPGYYPASGTIYAPPSGYFPPPIPERPSPDIVSWAKENIAELFHDFPFVSEADRAAAIALLLLPIIRDLIEGPTPLHLGHKPKGGTGGTLLAHVCCFPALGAWPSSTAPPEHESEWDRTITALLCSGVPVLLFDNAQELRSRALASAITSASQMGRVVRTSTVACAEARCVWVATGNNVVLSDEIARRTLPIRLDAKMEHPERRTEFLHPHLRDWVAAQRDVIQFSCFALVENWLAKGQPAGRKRLGGFEH